MRVGEKKEKKVNYTERETDRTERQMEKASDRGREIKINKKTAERECERVVIKIEYIIWARGDNKDYKIVGREGNRRESEREKERVKV